MKLSLNDRFFFDNLVFWYTVAALQSWLSWHVMTVDAGETSSPCEDALIISFAVLKPSVINWGTQLSLSVDIVDSDRGTSSPLFSVFVLGELGTQQILFGWTPLKWIPSVWTEAYRKGRFCINISRFPWSRQYFKSHPATPGVTKHSGKQRRKQMWSLDSDITLTQIWKVFPAFDNEFLVGGLEHELYFSTLGIIWNKIPTD